MKKLLVITLLVLFLSGCGTAAIESEFWKHDTLYRNWDHMKFSWHGYKNPTADVAQKAPKEGWWGIDIPYIPAG